MAEHALNQLHPPKKGRHKGYTESLLGGLHNSNHWSWVFITVMGPNHAETVQQELSTENTSKCCTVIPNINVDRTTI